MRRTFERPRHRWEYNIKIYMRKIYFMAVDYINLAQKAERTPPEQKIADN
jgi:hypothetical protein